MSHAGPADGDILNRQITGQKQQSGGWNPGAVANSFISLYLKERQIQMENINFSECIYSGKLWGMLNENILIITIFAIFGCSILSKWAIRDVINKRVNKKTWFALIFFSLTLLFSGTLLEGKIPDLFSKQCGSYAEIGIKFIVKMFDVFLLGILLLTTSFLMANRITEGQEKRNVDIQNKIHHQTLSKRNILIIIITTALATNIFTWIAFSIIN